MKGQRRDCERRRARFARLSVEALEERAMLDAAQTQLQEPAALAVEFDISPAWFQNLAPQIHAPPALEGSPHANGEIADQWVVQLSPASILHYPSPSAVKSYFAAGGFTVLRGLGRAGLLLIRAEGQSRVLAEHWLATSSNVAWYESNLILSLHLTPDDAFFTQTWGLHNNGSPIGKPDSDIDAPEAWNLATGSASIVVGVVDTGVDYTHVDLAANMWRNPGEIPGNALDDDANGFVDDVHGYDFVHNDGDPRDDNRHGTHVAGTIGAVGNNGAGVAGVNWTSSIMALKFLDSSGRGSLDNAVRAINYATMMRTTFGVNIVLTNNSWGGGGFRQSLYDAIAAHRNAGMLFVASAGNDTRDIDDLAVYPAGYDHHSIISVAASDQYDRLTTFSNYGAANVDLAAPGHSVHSTLPGNNYGNLSGTSMASPHVAGVAALAWSLSPAATWSQIRDAILAGVDSVATLDGQVATGGRLNARGTLDQLRMNVRASDPAPGGRVAAPPTAFTIDFTHAFAPGSIEPSDFRVNGVAATGVMLMDGDTARFTFAASPVTAQGAQTMSIAEGAVLRLVDGNTLGPWQATFFHDALPLAVAFTNPLQGQIIGAVPAEIVIAFNEPIAPLSIDASDLLLDFGTVSAVTMADSQTARFTVAGLVAGGIVRYSIAAGVITDAFGSPGAAYAGQFRIDGPNTEHFAAAAVPRAIDDQSILVSTIVIGDSFPLADMDVELDIDHPNLADLTAYLIAPDGTRVELFTKIGGSGDDFSGLVLDDEANSPVADAYSPFTGRFRPAAALAALDGFNVQGTWTLEIGDDSAGHTGSLIGWSLLAERDVDIAPRMTSVQPLPLEGGQTWLPIDSLSVRFSEGMDAASVTNATHWRLIEAGDDELFDTADDSPRVLAIAPYSGELTATIDLPGGVLVPGKYRFSALSGGLRDAAGNALDGNADGTGGDAYVRTFVVRPHLSEIPFTEGFESGAVAPGYWEFVADPRGRVVIDNRLPYAGTSALILETLLEYASPQYATLHVDLEGKSGLSFDFWQRHFMTAGGHVENRVQFSADGVTWHTLVSFDTQSKLTYQHFSFNLDAAVAASGIAYSRNFQIRFGHSNGFYGAGGFAFDEIRISQNDFTGPRVTSHTPAATSETLTSFTVTFNEPMDPASFTAGDVVVHGPGGSPLPVGNPVVGADGRTFTVPFLSPQAAAGNYILRVGPAIFDLAGNPMNQDSDATSGETNGQDDYDGQIMRGPPISQTIPWQQGFESLALADLAGLSFATSAGLIELTAQDDPHGGSRHLRLRSTTSGSSTRDVIAVLDLAGHASATNLAFGFWMKRASGSLAINVSGDGATWHPVAGATSLSPSGLSIYRPVAIDLDAALIAAGVARDADVYVRVRHTASNPNGLITIDDMRAGAFDLFGPKVDSSQSSGPVNSFTVRFSEAIDPATFTTNEIFVTGPTGFPVSLVGNPTTTDNRTFTITLNADVRGTYRYRVSSEVRDLAGNRLNQDGDPIAAEDGSTDEYSGTYVLGPPTPAAFPYLQTFEGNDLSALTEISYLTTSGTVDLTHLYKPHGERHLRLLGTAQQVTFAVDLSSQAGNANLALDFWLQTVIYTSSIAVNVSGNGTSFVAVPQGNNLAPRALEGYTRYAFDLDAILAAAGVALDGDVYIRLAHNGAEFTIDDFRVSDADAFGPRVTAADAGGPGNSFTITFSEAIDPTSFTASAITMFGPTGAAVTLLGDPEPSADLRTFTLRLPPGLPGQYRYEISSARDLAGNLLNLNQNLVSGELFEDTYRGAYQRHSTPAQTLPYFQSFDAGTLDLPGLHYGGTDEYDIGVTGENFPQSGAGHLQFSPTDGRPWVKLKLDLSSYVGATDLEFDFWAKLSGTLISFSFDVSGDDTLYYPPPAMSSIQFPVLGQYAHFAFDLDAALAANDIVFDEDVYLRLELPHANGRTMNIDDLRVGSFNSLGPRVVSHSQSVSTASFQVNFNEPVDPASFTAADLTVTGPTGFPVSIVGTPAPSADQRTYTITLDSNTRGRYAFQIGTTIADLAGNPLNQNGNWINAEAADQYASAFEFGPITAQPIPYFQGFETTTVASLGGFSFDANLAKLHLSVTSPHSGARQLEFEAGSGPGRAILLLDLTGHTGATNLALDFWLQRVTGVSDITVQVSGDGTNWTTTSQGADLSPPSSMHVHYAFDFDAALATASVVMDSSVYIRFTHEGSAGAKISLDDLRIGAHDAFGPRITEVVSPSGSELRITFNEPIDAATFTAGDLAITDPSGLAVAIGVPTTSDNRTFSVALPNSITGTYRVRIGPGIRDSAGNDMNQDGDPLLGEANDDDFESALVVGATPAQALPYLQSFDGDSLALPGWSYATTNVGIVETSTLNGPRSGVRHLQFRQTTDSTEQAILKLDLSAYAGASNLALEFWAKLLAATTGTFTVAVSANGATWTQIPQGSIALATALGAYTRFAFDFDAALVSAGIPVGGVVFLRLLHTASSATVAIDDLRIGQFDLLGPRVAAMTPTGSANVFTVTFDKPIDPATFASAVTIVGPSGSPVAISGMPATSADFRSFTVTLTGNLPGRYNVVISPMVRDTAGNSLNQDGDPIAGEIPQDQFTGSYTLGPPVAQAFPYFQDFEAGSLAGLPGWTFSTTGTSTLALDGANNPSGGYHLRFDRASTGTPVTQFVLDLAGQAGQNNLELDFWLQTVASGGSANSITVAVSGNGSSFIPVPGGSALRTSPGDYAQYAFDLDAALLNAGIALDHDVYIQFLHNGTSATHESTIDDVRVGTWICSGRRCNR